MWREFAKEIICRNFEFRRICISFLQSSYLSIAIMKLSKLPLLRPVGCFSVLLLAAVPGIQAQEVWDGDTSTDFETGANWVSGNAPANALTATNTATFGSTLPDGTTTFQPSLTVSRSIGGLIFQAPSGGWILGGSDYTLAIGTGGIDDSLNTNGTTTIHSNVSLGVSGQAGNQTWTTGANGNIEVTGSTILTGNRNLTVGGGTVTLASISGDSSNRTFSKAGTGTLVVTGAAGSNLTGFAFNGGQLGLGHQNAMGMLWAAEPCFIMVETSIQQRISREQMRFRMLLTTETITQVVQLLETIISSFPELSEFRLEMVASQV